jgi:hypothetical protein
MKGWSGQSFIATIFHVRVRQFIVLIVIIFKPFIAEIFLLALNASMLHCYDLILAFNAPHCYF